MFSGLARRCLGAVSKVTCSRKHLGARGFAEFEGFCTGRFRPGTQLLKSAMFTNFITRAGRTRFYHRSSAAHPKTSMRAEGMA